MTPREEDRLRRAQREARFGARQYTMIPEAEEYTGLLRKGDRDGDVEGWLFCERTGKVISFRGGRDPRPGRGYLIVGKEQIGIPEAVP